MHPNTVADARQKYRFRCDICGEPIGMLNEASHKQAAHADIMNLRRTMSARYLRRYLPLALFGLFLGGFSVFIHQWWWRLRFLGGIYLMLVVLVVFVRRAWREEKPLHRAIRLRCPVCDVQMSSQDLRIHLPAEHPEIYRERSAITYTSRAQTPTLVVHGENDACVPVNQAYAFYRALREHNVPVELVVYPREGHGPTEREHLRDMEERTSSWFEKYL